ncbi:hypothetical protein F4680DRAFT_446181 [Xylaria scruposa]|nr:hypothetical protein F4680DRAFT_446181 [Xylaria scruposa]
MNTTQPSDTLCSWPSQPTLAPLCALQDLTFRSLVHIAKIAQDAEIWILSSLGAPTHKLHRMFPSEDISDYRQVDRQLTTLFWLAVLIFCHLHGYLGPHPLKKPNGYDNHSLLVRVLFRGSYIIRCVLWYLTIPLVISKVQVATDQFEADGDVYLFCLRSAYIAILMAWS